VFPLFLVPFVFGGVGGENNNTVMQSRSRLYFKTSFTGGIVVGMQPKLTGTSSGLRAVEQPKDPDTSIHVEGFYRHQLTDNISITPGLIWLTAPNHNENNDDIFIGTIRTTFEF
jgi:hypothetical protein